MFFFFKFHRKLVRENKTTIENIEHKEEPEYKSKYDIDWDHNVEQVMGTNRWLWLVPIMPKSSIPKGQGIYFDKLYDSEASSDEEAEEEDRRPRNYEPSNDNQNQFNNQADGQRLGNTNGLANAGERQGNTGFQNPTSGNVQGDRMTIHNERENKWENLNNIVKSDTAGQIYKSSESNENSAALDSRGGNMKFTNKIDDKSFERK